MLNACGPWTVPVGIWRKVGVTRGCNGQEVEPGTSQVSAVHFVTMFKVSA